MTKRRFHFFIAWCIITTIAVSSAAVQLVFADAGPAFTGKCYLDNEMVQCEDLGQ